MSAEVIYDPAREREAARIVGAYLRLVYGLAAWEDDEAPRSPRREPVNVGADLSAKHYLEG
jgi:hypothetical protein